MVNVLGLSLFIKNYTRKCCVVEVEAAQEAIPAPIGQEDEDEGVDTLSPISSSPPPEENVS